MLELVDGDLGNLLDAGFERQTGVVEEDCGMAEFGDDGGVEGADLGRLLESRIGMVGEK